MLPKLEAFVETSIIQKRPSPISALQETIMVNYPQWAIRELLMNAVMHRDYSSNTPTKFYQYKDRLEIVNPGGLYGNARPENFPDVNDYRNPVIAEALRVMGYVNKFNRGIARVQKELVDNGNGKAIFTVDKITVFAVNVTNSKGRNVSEAAKGELESMLDVEDLSLPDKSLRVLELCLNEPHTKKELLILLGVTNQTINVRNIINPLLLAGCLAPIEEDRERMRNVRYAITVRGKSFLTYRAAQSPMENEQSEATKDNEPLLFPDLE